MDGSAKKIIKKMTETIKIDGEAKSQHTCTVFYSSISEQHQGSGKGTDWTATVWCRDNENPRESHPIYIVQQYFSLIRRIFSCFIDLRECKGLMLSAELSKMIFFS